MDRLLRAIEDLRAKLDGLRRRSLNEAATRRIVIEPVLQALGWDMHDPDEVSYEYTTVDGKLVDYALKLNRKPVLLVEAKPLDDPLNDVKAITQVVNYANNEGVAWCLLTNGIRWQVYRSVEKCPAPDKLMFEVRLDPSDSEGLSVGCLAERLTRFSRDEMAKGSLDALGEQVFTDGKVRKVLDVIMRDAPKPLLKIIRNMMGDDRISPQKIKESLARVWRNAGMGTLASPVDDPTASRSVSIKPSPGSKVVTSTRPGHRARKTESPFDEMHHISDKPHEVVELYRAIDRICRCVTPDAVEKRYLAKSINYEVNQRAFCSVHVYRGGLRVWLWLKYGRLDSPPPFARDVSDVGHWGGGDLELRISNLSQVDEASKLIRKSFEARA